MPADLGQQRWQSALLCTAFVCVLLVWAVACLHGLLDLFLWGHDGFNGAAFSQAARNSLRFEIPAAAPYHTGVDPPSSSEIYTRHPQLIHLHLIGSFAALGVSEWAARLVPALYSFATLLLLVHIARRWYGEGVALAAAVLYVLVPLHLIYANMVDHEQGGIFWSLATLQLYLRWLEDRRPRRLVATLAAVTLAVQFDWPAYTIAFAVLVHALWQALRGESESEGRRALAIFCAVFSATVLLNFFAHVAGSVGATGGLGDLAAGFARRSTLPAGYGRRLWTRALDLYGIVPLALLGLWAGDTVRRSLRGRLQPPDLVPIAFLAAQLVHSGVFSNAGYHHAYWTYYAGPAIALGGGRVFVSLLRWLRSRATAWGAGPPGRANTGRAPGLGLSVAVLAALLVFFAQGRFALEQTRWGYATGRASYEPDYDDQFLDHLWARALAERYGRSAIYLVHPSAKRRVHFDFYLDAERQAHSRIGFEPGERPRGALRPVLLLDLEALSPADLEAVAELAAWHPTRVWQQRFVAIEGWRKGRWIEGYSAVELEAPWWWSWLVSSVHPPTHWERNESPHEAKAALGSR